MPSGSYCLWERRLVIGRRQGVLISGCQFKYMGGISSFCNGVCYCIPAGFTHSAFALGYEGGINKCTIDGNMIPPGALITFVQKGLQYLEMEANLSNVSMFKLLLVKHFCFTCLGIYVDQGFFQACQSDADVDEDFSFLQPLDLITKDVNELQQIIKEKKKNLHKDREKEKEKEKDKDRDKDKDKDKEFEREHERECARVREKERHEREKEKEKDRERLESEKERDKQLEDNTDRRMVTDAEDKHEENEFFEGNLTSMYVFFFLWQF
jgi:transducin (beta)-like 1